jgi:hypothetical protein
MDAHLRGFPEGLPEIIDERTFQLGDTMTFDTRFGKFDCLGTRVEPVVTWTSRNTQS